MADAVVLPQVQPVRPVAQFFKLIPGVLLLAVVGYAGKLLEQTMINPALATKHYLSYLGELGRIATGGS